MPNTKTPTLLDRVIDKYAELLIEQKAVRSVDPAEVGEAKARSNARSYARRDCTRFVQSLRRADFATTADILESDDK